VVGQEEEGEVVGCVGEVENGEEKEALYEWSAEWIAADNLVNMIRSVTSSDGLPLKDRMPCI